MIAPRWRKAVRDIGERPGRSLLAVIAMAAGVFALGVIAFESAILRPALGSMYADTSPASATLVLDGADDALVDSVRAVAGVGDAEARPVLLSRARIGEDEWVPLILYVVRDFDRQRLDRFRPEGGAWPPGDGDVLIERSALSVARVAPAESLAVRTPGGDEHRLRVAGTVHAPGLAPAWMEHVVYGFVSWTSVTRAGGGESAQIRIVVADHPLDEGHVRETADRVKARLEALGHEVTRVDVPVPGRHPHADQMEIFIYLLSAFGILGFLLGSVMVASMVHALLAEQSRQVGMMKAIGATSRQIAAVYLGQVALLAGVSLAIGLPLAFVIGRAYARFSARILNADVTQSPFPLGTLLALIAVGLLVPLLVSLGPLARASRITVHQALGDDLGPRPFGSRWLERWLAGIAWFPRPLMLALRTTFVRRGRLALTVLNLALGGATFLAALNVSGAWTRAVNQDFRLRRYDATVRLAEPKPIAALHDSILALPGVAHAEYWPGASPYLVGASGVAGHPVSLVGPVPGSELLDLRVVDGRWLRPGDSTAAVINNAVRVRNSKLVVGGVVELRLHGRTLAYPIVGIVQELSPAPIVYVPAAAVLAATGSTGEKTRVIHVVTRDHSEAGQLAATRELERLFERMGIEVAGIHRMLEMKRGILDHLVIIQLILTMAAAIVVFVGSIGLTSTLTLDVVQRTRELGILSAIGARPRTLASHVWIEAVGIGLMSWVVANLLAAPISWALESVTGRMFFDAPLDFYLSPRASLIWLVLGVALATLSSLYPAARAARLTVREAISHA